MLIIDNSIIAGDIHIYECDRTTFIHLFAHYTITLSSLCRLVWKHWVHQMFARNILSIMCLRFSPFSQSSQYIQLCFQFTNLSFDDCVNISSYYHNQIRNMNHQPLFRIRSWNNGMHWMPCYRLFHDKSTLLQVLAWCHQCNKPYQNLSWTRSVMPYVTVGTYWILDQAVLRQSYLLTGTYWTSQMKLLDWSGPQDSFVSLVGLPILIRWYL